MERGQRERLPNRRKAVTDKVKIDGKTVHFSVGRFADGRLAEIFATADKVGAGMRATYEALATVISIAIQHGTPLEVITSALHGVDFQPQGEVEGHEKVKSARSLIDLLAKYLDAEAAR